MIMYGRLDFFELQTGYPFYLANEAGKLLNWPDAAYETVDTSYVLPRVIVLKLMRRIALILKMSWNTFDKIKFNFLLIALECTTNWISVEPLRPLLFPIVAAFISKHVKHI
jgi:hypothetical protein